MKTTITHFMIPILACLLILLSAGFSSGSSMPQRAIHIEERNQKAPLAKILPVLESRVGDRKLIERAKAKLTAMDDAEIRLVSSLCERMSRERGTPDADIAFLLVTALIVLS